MTESQEDDDPTVPALVHCFECPVDIPVWPNPAYPQVPAVLCDGYGHHTLRWPERPAPLQQYLDNRDQVRDAEADGGL